MKSNSLTVTLHEVTQDCQAEASIQQLTQSLRREKNPTIMRSALLPGNLRVLVDRHAELPQLAVETVNCSLERLDLRNREWEWGGRTDDIGVHGRRGEPLAATRLRIVGVLGLLGRRRRRGGGGSGSATRLAGLLIAGGEAREQG